jgi:glycosyltransferase involved in cell wall biosynthesis
MISSIVLAHNNRSSIERTLKSLCWCDEMIVVDDYSEDDTTTLATKCGAVVIKRHLNQDFAAQRNFGIEHAKGEWILFVDSDEVVSPALAKEIEATIRSSECDGFFLKRQDVLFRKKLQFGETANVRLLRLAKKEVGKWERPVHEVWNITGKTDTLLHPLEHYPHPTMTEFIADINHYSTVNAKLMYEEGKRVSWFDIVCYPKGKFIQNYVIRQGFRDGMPGAILAFMMSFHSFLTRGKLYAMQQK